MNKKIAVKKMIAVEIISTILLLTPFLTVKFYVSILEIIREKTSSNIILFIHLLLIAMFLLLIVFTTGYFRKKLLNENRSIYDHKSFSMLFFAIISFFIIYFLNSYQAVFYSIVVYPYTIIAFIIICVIPFIVYFTRSNVMNLILNILLFLSYYAFTALAILGIRVMILYGTAGAS